MHAHPPHTHTPTHMQYAGEKSPLPLFEAFVDGYVEKGRLQPAEAEMVADLINLRILSNVRGDPLIDR
jgi:Ser/Thr protein kinase RdoA (MazF antagonist)